MQLCPCTNRLAGHDHGQLCQRAALCPQSHLSSWLPGHSCSRHTSITLLSQSPLCMAAGAPPEWRWQQEATGRCIGPVRRAGRRRVCFWYVTAAGPSSTTTSSSSSRQRCPKLHAGILHTVAAALVPKGGVWVGHCRPLGVVAGWQRRTAASRQQLEQACGLIWLVNVLCNPAAEGTPVACCLWVLSQMLPALTCLATQLHLMTPQGKARRIPLTTRMSSQV